MDIKVLVREDLRDSPQSMVFWERSVRESKMRVGRIRVS